MQTRSVESKVTVGITVIPFAYGISEKRAFEKIVFGKKERNMKY